MLVTEHILLSKGLSSQFTPNTFIADSGAACHMRGSIEGMFNLKEYVRLVTMKQCPASLKGNTEDWLWKNMAYLLKSSYKMSSLYQNSWSICFL
jgi:hypothetical protein